MKQVLGDLPDLKPCVGKHGLKAVHGIVNDLV